MSRAQAFQLFRSCAASMSSRPSTNALALHRQARRAMAIGTRYYSDAKSESEGKEDEVKEESKSEEGASSTPSAESEWEAKLKAKEDEVTDIKSRLQYLQADFLNLQRNAAREKEQQKDFAISRFASDLLETVDVLALALKSVPQSALQPPTSSLSSTTTESSGPPTPDPNISSSPPQKSARDYLVELHHGVEMTHRLLLSTLFKYQVKPFDPTGDVFDPNKMEALYQAPIPNKEPGTVIDCQKTGYMIKDRVLRAAQVGVAQEVQS